MDGRFNDAPPHGTLLEVNVSVVALYDDAGNPSMFVALARNVSDLRRAETQLRSFQTLIESAPEGVSMSHADGRFFYANKAYRAMTGLGDAITDYSIFDVYNEPTDIMGAAAQQSIESGYWQGELTVKRPDTILLPVDVSVITLYDDAGQPSTFAAIARDMTERRRVAAEAQRAALQQEIIEAQQTALRELSTPLLPIADGVLVLPLIGTIDSTRAQQVMETLLLDVAKYQAHTVIMDITGVHAVDTQVAQALIRAAQSVRLLGAEVVLTGIQPQIAQTMVQLGINLQNISTYATLQAAVAATLGSRL